MMNWGILSPEDLGGLRRQQDLNLGAAVRYFNNRTVPGLGGLWFPVPIVWSVLAVSLAQKTGHGVLHLANAIEAKAMFDNLAYAKDNSRIRGRHKLAHVPNGEFTTLFPTGVYVAQPFRMGTGQPMRELGFVNGTRYNSFRLAPAGERLIGLLTECETKLLEWITQGKHGQGEVKEISPLASLPQAVSKLIRSRLVDGDGPDDEDAARRRNLIKLEEKKQSSVSLEQHAQPPKGVTAAHWADLRAGAALIDLREKALMVLSGVEGALKAKRDANARRQCLTPEEAASAVADQLDEIKKFASVVAKRIKAAGEESSIRFAAQCRDLAPKQLLRELARRDNSVICLRDDRIVPGPAAADLRSEVTETDAGHDKKDDRFARQLVRLKNLHCLHEELSERENPMSLGFPKASAS